jgi:hypothetical protein
MEGSIVDQSNDNSAEVLRGIWQQDASNLQDLDAECSPTKVCRNMKDVTFDGYAEEGGDVKAAWRNTLAQEGKLGTSSLADLVNGTEK